MRAAELIGQFSKMPREEQEMFLILLANQMPPEPRYVDEASFKAAKKIVLEENDGLLRRLAK